MKKALPALSLEFAGARLGDPRRNRRLERMAEAFADSPRGTLPLTMADGASLEGAYRFLGNDAISWEQILEPHFQATVARARRFETSFAIHDTSEFRFSGEVAREGLGPLGSAGQGFFGHFCLAVAGDGSKTPLGLLGLSTFTRVGKAKPETVSKNQKRRDPHRESIRWMQLARTVGNRASSSLIHVADREADIYALFAQLVGDEQRFIIRVAQNRKALTDDGDLMSLFQQLGSAKAVVARDVPLSRRASNNRAPALQRSHPVRDARTATLSFSAKSVTIFRAQGAATNLPKILTLNFVHVFEPEPPPGEDAVDWKLVTTEPIESVEDIEFVVEGYRARWMIEEYFKALKTGCGYEKSQLETKDALLRLLAVLAPNAWRLLVLRSLGRVEPKAPASTVLTKLEIEVIRKMYRKGLPPRPTVGNVLLAIAEWGGHVKASGPPGWMVLGRGFEKLRNFEEAWAAARKDLR